MIRSDDVWKAKGYIGQCLFSYQLHYLVILLQQMKYQGGEDQMEEAGDDYDDREEDDTDDDIETANLANKLPVFCCSATEYKKLKNPSTDHGLAKVSSSFWVNEPNLRKGESGLWGVEWTAKSDQDFCSSAVYYIQSRRLNLYKLKFLRKIHPSFKRIILVSN